jgi:hypothetical protein
VAVCGGARVRGGERVGVQAPAQHALGLDADEFGAGALVTCHLKSKLLTFPNGAFSTRDEALRARYGAYALYRRAAEAVTVRDTRDQAPGGTRPATGSDRAR